MAGYYYNYSALFNCYPLELFKTSGVYKMLKSDIIPIEDDNLVFEHDRDQSAEDLYYKEEYVGTYYNRIEVFVIDPELDDELFNELCSKYDIPDYSYYLYCNRYDEAGTIKKAFSTFSIEKHRNNNYAEFNYLYYNGDPIIKFNSYENREKGGYCVIVSDLKSISDFSKFRYVFTYASIYSDTVLQIAEHMEYAVLYATNNKCYLINQTNVVEKDENFIDFVKTDSICSDIRFLKTKSAKFN